MTRIKHKIESKNLLSDFLHLPVGNQKILIDNGFYQDTSFRGKYHVKYIHDLKSDVFFNERGTDKIRHTVFTKGTLKSSLAWTQLMFEKYLKERP
jgi:cytochrome b involved in lipid metabolism